MKGSGKMVVSTDMENIPAKMDIYMRDNGLRAKNKAKAIKYGRMVRITKDSLKKVSNMEGAV